MVSLENWHMGNTGEIVAEKIRSPVKNKTNLPLIHTVKLPSARRPVASRTR